jgi:uncharacterized membrane protein YphA (DoxX/SURF4 family)
MKVTVLIVRVLMGLLLVFSSVVVLFKLFPQPVVEGNIKIFNDGIAASIYLLPTLKVIELVCGIAFLVGRFIPLATVVIFPITLNILLFHVFVAPEGIPVAVLLFIANLFLAYHYRKNYQPLLAAKA